VNNKKVKLLSSAILIFSFVFVFLMASVALAQVTGVGPTSPTAIENLVRSIANWFQGIVLAIGIIMIIAAGLIWMTAGGDEEKMGKARRMLVYGLVGIAVAIVAYVAQTFIENLLGG
jgi:cytochrome bd-type quinol oxidase subunit 2